MADDPLRQLLALVAEGRLSAQEAAPLLAAIDGLASPRRSPVEPGGAPTAASPDAGPVETPPGPDGRGGASALRIEVRGNGRPVVSLRLPIAVGRFALDRVPGLSGDQVTRVREALRSGVLGPIVEVDEGGGDGVRIVLE